MLIEQLRGDTSNSVSFITDTLVLGISVVDGSTLEDVLFDLVVRYVFGVDGLCSDLTLETSGDDRMVDVLLLALRSSWTVLSWLVFLVLRFLMTVPPVAGVTFLPDRVVRTVKGS